MKTVTDLFDLTDFARADLFEGCEYPWEALLRLSTYLQKQKLGKIEIEIPQGVTLLHPELISIGKGSVIEPGAYIRGPCIIGRDCQVRHGAYMRGEVLVGDHCVIGHATEVKHSIFLDHAAAPHFNYVGDSILGARSNLGAGVILANYRLDHGLVSAHLEDRKIKTTMNKLGAIIGDEAQVGCNCVLSPGTVVGRGAFCFPCLHVDGYIPARGKVKPAQPNLIRK